MCGSVAGLVPARRQHSARTKATREQSKAPPGIRARYAVNIVRFGGRFGVCPAEIAMGGL